MNDKDKQTEKRLLRTYGISLAEYGTILVLQDYVCKICKRPPRKIRLSVDHDHKVEKQRLWIERLPDWNFGAFTDEHSSSAIAIGTTKTEARENARRELKRRSIRGLLCSQCNRALGKVEDPRWQWTPVELRAAADYLEAFSGKKSDS